MSELRVESVEASVLYELRRRILRNNDQSAAVDFEEDHAPTARHFAGLLDGRVVVSASFFLAAAPVRDELVSYQLRFMAVDADFQGRGFGAAVLEAAEATLLELGAEQLWANARDVALGFYEATGWSVVEGSNNMSPVSGLPHTKITKVLSSANIT